jgi:ribosomal protein L19E
MTSRTCKQLDKLLEIQSEFQELVAQIMQIFEEASILAGFDEQNVKIQIPEYSRQIAAMFGDDIKTLIAQNELRMKQLADLHLTPGQPLKDVDKLKRGHNISLKVIKRENDDIPRNWASRLDSLNKQQTDSVAANDRLRIQNKNYVGAIKNWTSKVEALNKELAELKAENERLSTPNKEDDVSIKRWVSRVRALDEELAVLKFENACLSTKNNEQVEKVNHWMGWASDRDRQAVELKASEKGLLRELVRPIPS